MAKNSYKASDIEVLEGLEPVRKRPGMYIGGTSSAGLHHLIQEILDNSVDEAMNGHASEISVILEKDSQTISIIDNGRGIPVDEHPKFKKSALEVILTTLHAGGKFSDANYASAGGLHGVGASVVNALSEKFIARVKRDGNEWEQTFSRGLPTSKLKKLGKTKENGTLIQFKADSEIFKDINFNTDKIAEMIKIKAFLNKGLKFGWTDQVNNKKEVFCFNDGIKSFLAEILKKRNLESITGDIFYFDSAKDLKIEIALAWTEASSETIFSFVNGIETKEGGTHVDGFKSGLTKAIRNYANVHNLIPKGVKVIAEDIREGLHAVISLTVPASFAQIQFQGQTKDKLNNAELLAPVDSLTKSIENELNSRPKIANQIIERVVLAARARMAARSASDSVSRKIGISHRLNLPGKLADCSSNRSDQSEIFIVEGDSAGGSTKQGRDRKTQAVFPLRGKILNSIASGSKIQDNKELLDLVSALGCGWGEGLNLAKLRYGKVVILTDADSDGMHIATLLMAFFYKYMRPLIDKGHIYLGCPPLFRIKFGAKQDDTHWVYSDQEKEAVLKQNSKRKYQVTRFKGLGEMNPDTLWSTTLNPKTRNLIQVKVEKESETEEILNALLGKDSSTRYNLIQDNAHRLELDL